MPDLMSKRPFRTTVTPDSRHYVACRSFYVARKIFLVPHKFAYVARCLKYVTCANKQDSHGCKKMTDEIFKKLLQLLCPSFVLAYLCIQIQGSKY